MIAEIDANGPIPFEAFMELALYDPSGGFFATGPLRSQKSGDFLTSPEVSSAFGATLGRYVEAEYDRLGRPADFDIVEVGAGSGSLLEPLLDTLTFSPMVTAVEASTAARDALAKRLPHISVMAPSVGIAATWQGVLIANELVDNLPMAIAVKEVTGWTERWVGTDRGDLRLVEVSARSEVLDWLEENAEGTEVEGIVEVQLAAGDWLAESASSLESGSIVVIDYGDTAELLAPRRSTGTLRTYREHHLGPPPLDEPGKTDITADVNFTALGHAAVAAGMSYSLARQDDFLASLGLRERLATLRGRELELARGDDSMERLRVRNDVREVETILHPRGLGDFRVLVCTR